MNTEVRIIGKDDLDIEKIRVEINRIVAETHKLNAETRWHAFYKVAMWWGSAFAAAIALITLVKNLLP